MTLRVNDRAKGFTLNSYDGKSYSLHSLEGYKLLIFYKVTCPTCQFTFPFIEKMFKWYGEKIHFLGIAQDSSKEVYEFSKGYGFTFPQLIDAPSYETSKAYDVETVPTIYLIDEWKILFITQGFVKSELENLNFILSSLSDLQALDLFEDKRVPEFKPG